MIEKMKFISVIGPKDQLDTVTRQYLCRYEIQLENAMGELKHLNNITPNAELNPYREAAGRAAEIAALYGSKATAVRDMDVDTAMERITEVQNRIQKADRETDALEKELKKERGLLDAVSPYQELHFDISRILHFKEVRFRFGRLPVGYYERLKTYAYDDACTIFEKCKETEDYVWGVYFVPAAEAKKVDAIYASLHFERIHLEDAYEGTVDEACRELKEKTDALEQQITAVRAELAKELNGMSESISAASKTLAYESKLFDVRKLAAFTKAKNETFFILCGWMENKEADLLKKELEKQGILVVMTREGEDDLSDPGAVNAKVQDLQRRVQLIHEKKPDCVISIHQNSYPDAAVKGAQVFYYTDSKEGEKLALCMQAALVAGLDPANHRKAKGNKTYYMLKKTDAVLVICECGFLSNPEEEALLNTKEYQKKVADALCDGVLTYLGEKKNGKEKTQTKTEETAAGAASAYACPAGGLSGIRRI